MKKIRHLALSAAVLFSVGSLSAQPAGYLPFFPEFTVSHMYDLSNYRTNLGTARSAAMGGAFVSLGADLSSMHINPAGLGLYQASEFGFTFGPQITTMTTSMRGEQTISDSRTSLSLNNVGLAFNVFQGTRGVTSFTFGVGYNRLADFNSRSNATVNNGGLSILDMFAPQVTEYVKAKNWDSNMLNGSNPWKANPDRPSGGAYLTEFGAMLAYKTGLIDYFGNDRTSMIVGLAPGADIQKRFNTLSKGSIGEFAFSGGWNFNNKFYFGLSLGIIDIYRKQELTYTEDYSNNQVEAGDPVAEYMDYYQSLKTVGEGYNFKLGVIVRPVPELRIGVAFHSPNIITVKNYYYSSMRSKFKGSSRKNDFSPELDFTDYFYSPSRLLAGVSYTIGTTAIIALDYEHAWYNGIRLRTDNYDSSLKDGLKNDVKALLNGSHTVRLGTEIRATDQLSIRAGYNFTYEGLSDKVRDGSEVLNIPLQTQSNTISAGLGYRITPWLNLDMTYIYSAAKYTDYDIFYYRNTLVDPNEIIFPGGESNGSFFASALKQQRHNVMLSLSYRF